MKWYITYFLTCIFLCAGSLTEVSANSQKTADNLFAAGNFFEAAIEYERAAFMAEGNIDRTYALLGKAGCLKQTGRYADAEHCLERINYQNLTDTLVFTSHYQSGLCSYLAGDLGNAENHLLQIQHFVSDSVLSRPSLVLYSFVLNELGRWAEAKEKLLKLISLSPYPAQQKDSLNKIVDRLYVPKNYPHLKKISKAQLLSTFLPGAGQMYAGYFWEGVTSLSIQIAAIGFVGYNIIIRHYFTAFTIGTGIFQRFYFGGINRLDYLVGKKNHALLRNYNDPLRKEIINMNF